MTTATASETKRSDSAIIKEMNMRISNDEDKANTSGRIRTLARMNVSIKEIVRLLQLTQFQHAYVVMRKADLLPNAIKTRTKQGNCAFCNKPFYTEASKQAGAGLICRNREHAQQSEEAIEVEA